MKTYWKQEPTESSNPIRWMIDELNYMLVEMDRIIEEHKDNLIKTHPSNQLSAKNLLNYLTFRSYDIRQMQDQLHGMGLSSLASAESHIKFQLSQVITILEKTQNQLFNGSPPQSPGPKEATHISWQKKQELLGKQDEEGTPHLMVTLPSEAAKDPKLVKDLLLGGMSIVRINLAHDTAEDWQQMVENTNAARKETGLSCKIYMDLPGPKIRTSTLVQIGKKYKNVKKVELTEDASIVITSTEHAEKSKSYFEGKDDSVAAIIGCTFPELLESAAVGHRIYFDDGKFECIVTGVYKDHITSKVTRVPPSKPFLKEDKGINFPDSEQQPGPLTSTDLELLPIVCKEADLVGYSFVSRANDVQELQKALLELSSSPPAIILKIERQSAVDHLAELLLQGMQMQNFGVMIARGDLGIEVGFERLSEVQEEILWMCEAAHTPVIWATQELESLNKTGMATRAEISDVALASAADCIMLNKGEHILESLETIRNIAHRMKGHMLKKRYILRPLSIARRFTIKN